MPNHKSSPKPAKKETPKEVPEVRKKGVRTKADEKKLMEQSEKFVEKVPNKNYPQR